MLRIHRATREELHSPPVRRILAQSVYKPDDGDRLARALGLYDAPDAAVLVGSLHSEPVAVLGSLRDDTGFEIRHLAVSYHYRGRKFGRSIVDLFVESVASELVHLETDSDAVEFYRRCGFACRSLGEKYPGIERFRCTRRHGPDKPLACPTD